MIAVNDLALESSDLVSTNDLVNGTLTPRMALCGQGLHTAKILNRRKNAPTICDLRGFGKNHT